jgi:hypothetical protein
MAEPIESMFKFEETGVTALGDVYRVLNDFCKFTCTENIYDEEVVHRDLPKAIDGKVENNWPTGRIFSVPGKDVVPESVYKAIEQSEKCELIIMLVPADTDSAWFKKLPTSIEFYMLKNRIFNSNIKVKTDKPYTLLFFGRKKGLFYKALLTLWTRATKDKLSQNWILKGHPGKWHNLFGVVK